MINSTLTVLLTGVSMLVVMGSGDAPARQVRPVTTIVAEIMRADYEGNLAALLRLYEELAPEAESTRHASRIRYWRGFARWRRAINGVNDGAPVAQMREDLQIAATEFEAALQIDPLFVDGKAALLSSIGIQLFLANGDPALTKPLIERARPMLNELQSAPQDNPRMVWVLGQSQWRTPRDWPREQVLAHQERVIATYVRALEQLRARTNQAASSLDPRWGEPELLMNLAWSNLNKATPDLAAAERYAREALALVPHWHYLRDILLPQIEKAKRP